MIDLYSWGTTNGCKISIMLEECGLPYTLILVDLFKNEQFEPKFLRISPNNRIPAIVDHDPSDGGNAISLFESGPILEYLAEKTGKYMPADLRARYEVKQWLAWQIAGLGPMAGQANHFRYRAKEEVPYGIERYGNEVHRLCGVLDRRLADRRYICGDEYTIADIASWSWLMIYDRLKVDPEEFRNIARWLDDVWERPAVQKGYFVLKESPPKLPIGNVASPR